LKGEENVLNLEAIAGTPVRSAPFRFFMVPGVLSAVDLAAVRADFPHITKPGLFPLSELRYGPAFARLIEDIHSPELQKVIEAKYGVDLSDRPLMITVRGQCQLKDGRIHSDSKTKFLTCLLYLNDIWDESGGRLRMLRNKNDLDDYAVEVPPDGGTLASFLRADNSWHGHEPYVGERRYILFNWMTSQVTLDREIGRHSLSAKVKHHLPALYR
jgi:SM-20-related protein